MAVNVNSKCWILALFIRDDGERFVLGDGAYDFKDSQQHFVANAMVNDTIDVQGNDGTLIAGQVRRASTQSFDGYIGDASLSKQQVEIKRREFIQFFAKNHFYTVVYVFHDGSAVKRQRGFIVDAPQAKELWQIHPEYHVALNFEDVNYYAYSEDKDGNELYGQRVTVNTSDVDSGGLVWDENGAVMIAGGNVIKNASGETIVVNNAAARSLSSFELYGDISQDGTPTPSAPVTVQTVTGKNTVTITGSGGTKSQVVELSGKNYCPVNNSFPITTNGVTVTQEEDGTLVLNGTSTANTNIRVSAPNILSSLASLSGKTVTMSAEISGTCSHPDGLVAANIISNTNTRIVEIAWDGATPYKKTQTLNISGYTSAYINIYFWSGRTFTGYKIKLQLEEGSTATSYAPYFEPVELCKIGTAQDYIYKSGSDWYIHKAVDSTVLTDSINWYISRDTNTYFRFGSQGNFLNQAKVDSSSVNIISDYFMGVTQVESDGGATNGICTKSPGCMVSIPKTLTEVTSISTFQSWLGVNLPKVYYVLATPTDTKITAETLIEELDAVLSTSLYEGTNTITTQTVNLQPTLNISYEEQTDEPGGFEWEEGGGASIVSVTVDSISDVYPVLVINGPTVEPEIDNLTTGKYIKYNGSIAEGQTLVVDMTTQTAKLNGANVVANLSGSWLSLAPGINRLTFTAENPDAPNATMEWNEVVG